MIIDRLKKQFFLNICHVTLITIVNLNWGVNRWMGGRIGVIRSGPPTEHISFLHKTFKIGNALNVAEPKGTEGRYMTWPEAL